ncbi:MAG: nuclear transport factor 2 family protein [Spongiibacteraceae bacterium]|jgi:hypothetical protein|nr:nuclear transport factor 2 family protein [Spongiibacteraceae bacterium]
MNQDSQITALQQELATLKRQVTALEDINAIRHLQYAYGYYIDKCLYDEAVDLFADECETYFLNGIYKGKEGVRRLYCTWFREHFTEGYNGPIDGFLLDHLIMQDIIHIDEDGTTARIRARCFMQGGVHRSAPRKVPNFPEQNLEGGIYENIFVKEDGIWKIKVLNYNMLWQADMPEGWAHTEAHLMPLTRTFPEDPRGPDALLDHAPETWPRTRVVPFHYAHPVTGKMWQPVPREKM